MSEHNNILNRLYIVENLLNKDRELRNDLDLPEILFCSLGLKLNAFQVLCQISRHHPYDEQLIKVWKTQEIRELSICLASLNITKISQGIWKKDYENLKIIVKILFSESFDQLLSKPID